MSDETPKAGTRGDRMLFGRVNAVLALLPRSGVTDVEFAFEEEMPPRWWAKGNWSGTRVYSAEGWPYPAQALEDLLGRVLNGGTCARCGRTTIVGIIVEGLCCFTLAATDLDDPDSYAYVRSCEVGA